MTARPGRRLVIFVRAPRFGAVKRRLAADVGALAAWRFYRGVAAGTVARLAADRRWYAVVAVTPDGFAGRGRFWPAAVPRRRQGPGDLGRRMAAQLRAGPPGPVVVVGSDIPGLRPRHVADAFAALAAGAEWVFGPAADGGFWLVGTARRRALPAPARLFAGVRWSTAHALADALAALPPGARVARLETLRDIDRGADLAAAEGQP